MSIMFELLASKVECQNSWANQADFWNGFHKKGSSLVTSSKKLELSHYWLFIICEIRSYNHYYYYYYNCFTALGILSGTTRVSRYQKKHSPTHTYHGHQSSLICFLHLLRSMLSSLFNLCAWQCFCKITLQVFFGLPLSLHPPLHTPIAYNYINIFFKCKDLIPQRDKLQLLPHLNLSFYCQKTYQSPRQSAFCITVPVQSSTLIFNLTGTAICLQYIDAVGWAAGRASGLLKNWVVGCWRGYLSGGRCRFAYGPTDATANHYLLLQ